MIYLQKTIDFIDSVDNYFITFVFNLSGQSRSLKSDGPQLYMVDNSNIASQAEKQQAELVSRDKSELNPDYSLASEHIELDEGTDKNETETQRSTQPQQQQQMQGTAGEKEVTNSDGHTAEKVHHQKNIQHHNKHHTEERKTRDL